MLVTVTRSASKEGTQTAGVLPHARVCTEDPIFALQKRRLKEKFGASAEFPHILLEKTEVHALPVVDLIAASAKILF